MAIQEVRVKTLPHLEDIKGKQLLHEIRNTLHITSITGLVTAKVYRLEGITAQQAEFLARHLLAEEVFQTYTVNEAIIKDTDKLVEVAYKPGVMNPEAGSIVKAAADLGITEMLAADSSYEYGFYGTLTDDETRLILTRLLVNETVERVVTEKPATLIIKGRPGGTRVIPIRHMDDEALLELSRDNLFLNIEEMRSIQGYFAALDRDPTDCEIETLAQTWSEHCVHKTFKATIMVDGQAKKPLYQRLRESTDRTAHPLVLSAFEDNSGVIEFYDGLALCGKVETHNSPSAIEPYGGAMTGSGGVFRDIMGTGKGAKVIASTDMFCFAPPDLPTADVPPGCLHPHYLLRRVVDGVRDYGNRMGIPTNNGSVHFHRDFRAKPTIIVGAYGIMPAADAGKGQPVNGDLAVIVGGRTGRDGIHGATFSSGEMTHRTMDVNASAVQIGHAIEEKRMSDALLRARDEKLIRAVTDCGAGGFASAFGEMGEGTGVRVHLERAPLKYQGLAPWEIWLSESQERMALAVDPAHMERLADICREHNVEVTVIGQFTGTGKLEVLYQDELVCELDMEFLHHGIPGRTMTAVPREHTVQIIEPDMPGDWEQICTNVMQHLNVCSKEPIVRMYDHGVQGSSALPPFAGVAGDAPNDAVVIAPLLGQKYGAVIAHGLNPVLNTIDPYAGSIWAAAEAVSNAVATGANPDELVLIDNFIWPYPDETSLYDLDRAVDACVDFVKATGMPFISGKDSLSSTYRAPDGSVIKIPPVLCISCFGRIADVTQTISTDFKRSGSIIALVGQRDINQMGGSTYFDITGAASNRVPLIDPALLTVTLRSLHRAIRSDAILACHDISEGGLLVALAEMCLGGGVGAAINLPANQRADYCLFNETAGCFVVELTDRARAEELFQDVPYLILGCTTSNHNISVTQDNNSIFNIATAKLFKAWQKPMQEVFGGC
ncbi:phosphoribosylformylglycinamidine synthase subunit PurL [Desulfoscipio gibsoniae]|uniref:Phosphoribosylformylglycinamidine synthase subunit PurL n=1 Tax=Desulfoscipio gibsoniae DSM 7213 TaxID=767817 RepID=R4KIU1_9FIRM|nr:phosphoribosylformylglycinamidine synthase subunit PurL [Desulfoscipio gibsoniae]AGL01532.1 phosphoribosylformylglycinamidine synthase II [Desulfoscipio gibsoniae DSM 7213]